MTVTETGLEWLLVAIDVAKHSNEALVQWPSGHTQAFRVPNQRPDFERFTTDARLQTG